MTLSIAHLSDPHIAVGPLGAAPAEGLYRALGRGLAINPTPALFVITGDLVDRGTLAEYQALYELVERFPSPLDLVPGNHDDPNVFLEVFGGTRFVAHGARTHFCVERADLTLVCLDSSVVASATGRLTDEQLNFVDEALSRRPEVPAFLALHHPPVDLGMPFLDGMRLTNGDELVAILDRHKNVVRVLAGHVHRPVIAPMSCTILATAASTHLASALALNVDVPHYVAEPTSFLLHVESGGRWITHTISASHTAFAIACF